MLCPSFLFSLQGLKQWCYLFETLVPCLSNSRTFPPFLSPVWYRTSSSFAGSSSSCRVSGGVLPSRVLDSALGSLYPFQGGHPPASLMRFAQLPRSPSSLHPLSVCGAVCTHHVGNGSPNYCAPYVLCLSPSSDCELRRARTETNISQALPSCLLQASWQMT